MANGAEGSSDWHDIENLADRIDVLSRERVDGAGPMVVDALAEAWRRGLPSAVGEAAIILSARRRTVLVCCPLGRLVPTAAILPNDIAAGLSFEEVRSLIGEPARESVSHGGFTWLHALRCAAREDDGSNGTDYPTRQAAWPRSDASADDPPFAPLATGERMFRVTSFAAGRVAGGSVTVLRDAGLRPGR